MPGEPQLGFKPVAVDITDPREKLRATSRFDYYTYFTVEHNSKVVIIGHVISEDLESFLEAASATGESSRSPYKRKKEARDYFSQAQAKKRKDYRHLLSPSSFEPSFSSKDQGEDTLSDLSEKEHWRHVEQHSMGSAMTSIDSSTQGLPQNAFKECMTCIGNHIINAVGRTLWFQASLSRRSPSFVDISLANILKDFTSELIAQLPVNELKAIAIAALNFIRFQRFRISLYVRVESQAQRYPSTDELKQQRLALAQHLSQVNGFKTGDWGTGTERDDPKNDDSETREAVDGNLDFSPISNFLFGGQAFSNLRKAIRMVLSSAEIPPMNSIRTTVLDTLSKRHESPCLECQMSTWGSQNSLCSHGTRYLLHMTTDWKPAEFMTTQFGNQIPSIGSVITYTGLASCALAITCSEYLKITWPSSDIPLVDALDLLLRSEQKQIPQLNYITGMSQFEACDETGFTLLFPRRFAAFRSATANSIAMTSCFEQRKCKIGLLEGWKYRDRGPWDTPWTDMFGATNRMDVDRYALATFAERKR